MKDYYSGLDIKWLGSLNGCNLENLTQREIEELKLKKIINQGVSKDDRFSLLEINLGNENYFLNQSIRNELIGVFQAIVELIIADPHYKINLLKANLNAFLSKQDKIDYLISEHKHIYPVDDTKYLMYLNEESLIGYQWEDYFEVEISSIEGLLQKYLAFDTSSHHYLLHNEFIVRISHIYSVIIDEFISPEQKEEVEDFLRDWGKYYEIESLLSFINRELLQLKNGTIPLADSLESLFKNKKLYDDFIKLLTLKGFLTNKNGLNFRECNEKKFYSALCFYLMKIEVLNTNNAKKIITALNQEFGLRISESTFSEHKKHFNSLWNNSEEKDNEELNELHFLTQLRY